MKLNDLAIKIDKLSEKIDENFKKIDERFEKIDQKFEKIDERFERIDERFERIDERFERIDERFEKVDERFDKVDSEIRDMRETQFYFEETYGKKIDITYDGVLALQELLKKDSDNLEKIDMRVNNLEVKSYKYDDYEKRILSLENNINSNI